MLPCTKYCELPYSIDVVWAILNGHNYDCNRRHYHGMVNDDDDKDNDETDNDDDDNDNDDHDDDDDDDGDDDDDNDD